MKDSKIWLLFREATEFDMRLLDPYGHSIGELDSNNSVILHAFAFSRDLIDAYISSHKGLKLFLKKEKHTNDYCIEFEHMNLLNKIMYYPLHCRGRDGHEVCYTVAMTTAERATLDNYQRNPRTIFAPRFDYMNMCDEIHGALLRLKYNEFFNDAHFNDGSAGDYITDYNPRNNNLKSSFMIDEMWLFNKMIRESPAYYERR